MWVQIMVKGMGGLEISLLSLSAVLVILNH